MPPPADSGNFRLATSFTKGKGKWIAEGFSSDGIRHEYEILIRHLTPELKRRLQRLKQGDSVHASNVQPAGTSLRFDGLQRGLVQPELTTETQRTRSSERDFFLQLLIPDSVSSMSHGQLSRLRIRDERILSILR